MNRFPIKFANHSQRILYLWHIIYGLSHDRYYYNTYALGVNRMHSRNGVDNRRRLLGPFWYALDKIWITLSYMNHFPIKFANHSRRILYLWHTIYGLSHDRYDYNTYALGVNRMHNATDALHYWLCKATHSSISCQNWYYRSLCHCDTMWSVFQVTFIPHWAT